MNELINLLKEIKQRLLIDVDENGEPKSSIDDLLKMWEKVDEVILNNGFPSEIRDEMDADMEDSGMAQGEIESCLNHWRRKYNIQRK